MVTLRIDDQETTVAEGTLIIEAARGMGIEIPHFCYHPKLSVSGACRMCLVEVKGLAKLATACTTPVSPNMVVRTRSEKVKEAQRGVIAMLLMNHPLDCPVWDKGGECPLQDPGTLLCKPDDGPCDGKGLLHRRCGGHHREY